MQARPATTTADPAALLVATRLAADEVSRRIVEACRALRAAGWVSIVAGADGPLAREVRQAGGRLEEVVLDRSGPWARFRARRRLARILRGSGARLVHLHRRAGGGLAAACAAHAGVPILATVHDPAELQARRADDQHLLAADRLVAVSEHVAETLVERLKVPAERVRVIPPGVDLDELDPERVRGPRVLALAERWGLDVERRIVLLPGPLERARGHLYAIEAVARLARRDLWLVLVGEEDPPAGYVREIETAIRRAGLGDRVRFGGPPGDEAAALQLADVVLLPAVEPLPSARVVAAAQAMGRPVIVTGLGALPECVQPASTGWIVPHDDAGELAWALDRALSLDDAVKERLALRARAFAAEAFAAERVARKLVELYREVTRPGARGTGSG